MHSDLSPALGRRWGRGKTLFRFGKDATKRNCLRRKSYRHVKVDADKTKQQAQHSEQSVQEKQSQYASKICFARFEAELDGIESCKFSIGHQRIGEHTEDLKTEAHDHDDENKNYFHAKKRCHETSHFFIACATPRRVGGHHCDNEDVVGHHDDKHGNHFDGGHHQPRHEMIETLEQQTKFKRPPAHLLEQTEKESDHHRAHQHDGHCAANQQGDDGETQEQPVLILDQGPTLLDAFHGLDYADAKIRIIGGHESSSILVMTFTMAAKWHAT